MVGLVVAVCLCVRVRVSREVQWVHQFSVRQSQSRAFVTLKEYRFSVRPPQRPPFFMKGGTHPMLLLLLLATLLLVAAATTADPATANTLHAARALNQRAPHVLWLQVA